MDKIIIPVHSFVDLITNSSTELFVLDTDKTIATIKEILQSAIDLHNAASGEKLKFYDVFEDPYEGNIKEALEGFKDYYSAAGDGIILSGASDNSIPYWMFEFINSAFGYSTQRFHLG